MNYEPLLRHFSVTDGLVRGTRMVNYVVNVASFAMLPAFGAHGFLIVSAIQDLISGAVEVPFGWVADRFGWSKAVIWSYGLKVLEALLLPAAVLAAYYGKLEWCWALITLEAIVDAFIISLQNGAYEAAYTEWYRVKVRDGAGEVESAPPLFLRSLRYAMRIRLAIPLSVIAVVMALQFFSKKVNFDVYLATLVAYAIIVVLRAIVFVRIYLDLRPIVHEESERVQRHGELKGIRIVKEALAPVRRHFKAFAYYSLACFQWGFSAIGIAGITMKQMGQLSLSPSSAWIAGVALTLMIYIVESVFWMILGYRIEKTNARSWMKGFTFLLLFVSLMTSALCLASARPFLQALGFASCTFASILCAGAIKRFFASHIREWLESDLVATWFSLAESLSFLLVGVSSAAIVLLDRWIPTALSILVVCVVVALFLLLLGDRGRQKTDMLRS